MAKTHAHIKAGVDFARENNVRLVVRNTGHDFLGRSTGWGSLVINTHGFREYNFTASYAGPGGYRGPAVTIGAGTQARDFLKICHAQKPPLAVVTGECPVGPVTECGLDSRTWLTCKPDRGNIGRDSTGRRPRAVDAAQGIQ